MSKVTFVGYLSGSIMSNDIPKGTFFIGRIGDCEMHHFLKAYECVVSIADGETWSGNVKVNEYRECDVELSFKPVR